MQRLVVEYVTGAQNNTRGVPHDASHRGPPLLSGMCCKHVAAYDVEDSRYTFNASVDKRNLWESYLPAFKGCISEVQHILVPTSAHHNVSALLSSDLLHLPRRTPGEGFACDVLVPSPAIIYGIFICRICM
jgi:beta-glucosidase-like glycosyl hydrolase